MPWQLNDDGDLVPRRTTGSVAAGYGQDDFTLACSFCEDDFGSDPDLPMGVIGPHFAKHHPEKQQIELRLLWLGQGPSPQPNQVN